MASSAKLGTINDCAIQTGKPRIADVSPTSLIPSAPAAVRHAINAPKSPTRSEPSASSAATLRVPRLCVKKSTFTSPRTMWQYAKNAADANAAPICKSSTSPGTVHERTLRPTIDTISIAAIATDTRPADIATYFDTSSKMRPPGPSFGPGACSPPTNSASFIDLPRPLCSFDQLAQMIGQPHGPNALRVIRVKRRAKLTRSHCRDDSGQSALPGTVTQFQRPTSDVPSLPVAA